MAWCSVDVETSDGRLFRVDANFVRQSTALLHHLQQKLTSGAGRMNKVGGEVDVADDAGTKLSDDVDFVRLDHVDSENLRLIATWCAHHKSVDPKKCEANLRHGDAIPAWDEQFLANLDRQQLYELILAANFLGIRGLVYVCCRKASDLMKIENVRSSSTFVQ